jgi:hypothetical protein
MMLDGHRRFLAVERRGSTTIADAIRAAAKRYAPDATVEPAFPNDVAAAVQNGATGVVCDSTECAVDVKAVLDRANVAIPARVSLAAIGIAPAANAPCSGYFVTPEQKADAIVQLLRDAGASRKPTTLWLAGAYVDAGTTGPTESMIDAPARVRFDAASA